jgi:hypothetical protein
MLGFATCGASTLEPHYECQNAEVMAGHSPVGHVHVVPLAHYAAVHTRFCAADSSNALIRFPGHSPK